MTNPFCNAAYKAKDITSENFTHKIILLSIVLFMIFIYTVWCLSLVLVSWKCGKVSVSISSRTENQMSRSRLGLVYKPICTAFCVIAKLHVHRFECRASILFTDSQGLVYIPVAYICNCNAVHNQKSPFP